jgi:hypothetical protein
VPARAAACCLRGAFVRRDDGAVRGGAGQAAGAFRVVARRWLDRPRASYRRQNSSACALDSRQAEIPRALRAARPRIHSGRNAGPL